MTYIHTDVLGRDPAYRETPWFETIAVESGGCPIFGTVMVPGVQEGDTAESRPCAIVLHGYPGHIVTLDLCQNLWRAGFAAVHLSYRGVGGSKGCYTFSGLIEDAIATAEYLHQEDTAAHFHIDRDNIFFVGHSMGGFTAINAARRLPWLKGLAAISPYDLAGLLEAGEEKRVKALLDGGMQVLTVASPEALYDDARKCRDNGMALSRAASDLKDRNVLFIGADRDDVAPAAEMIEPLWQALQEQGTRAKQDYTLLASDHQYNDQRYTVCRLLADWLATVSGIGEQK